ncbi:MAG TPA: hypothetical protein VFN30_06230 [Chitinophagaceae bacterium]|nr:hypothetical protein [Chitinophagaceae bacterium]
MSEMEPEVKRFLQKIVWTIFAVLFWMMINIFIGVYKELGFPDKKVSGWNLGFYLFALITFVFLIRYLMRLWREK